MNWLVPTALPVPQIGRVNSADVGDDGTDEEEMRVCSSCGGDPQPIENFYIVNDKSREKGWRYLHKCRECIRKYRRGRKAAK